MQSEFSGGLLMNKTSDRKSGILVVEDHPLVVLALSQIINDQADMYCCGEARDMANARKAFSTCMPDLVLVDLGLPDGDGVELIKEFSKARPYIPILVVSQHGKSSYAERALDAGACGYLEKGRSTKEIVAAIRSVLDDEISVTLEEVKRIQSRTQG
jgi:DNA-binding NarL/FixJ family response regulator